MLGTEARTSFEAFGSKSKSKLLSRVTSDYLTVDRSSQDHLENEIIRQLKDPEAVKKHQLKQLRKIVKKCEGFH